MFVLTLLLVFGLVHFTSVSANTEKIIFDGPPEVSIPQTVPSLSALNLEALTPDEWSIRKHVDAAFPTAERPHGLSSWYLLDNLTEGQGYELRVCWAATQPTRFRLTAYSLRTVFESAELIGSLNEYEKSHTYETTDKQNHVSLDTLRRSAMLLRLDTEAEYFTTNTTLMKYPAPVFIDIILDPHFIPGIPRTLVPTIGSIIVVGVGSFFLALKISSWLGSLAADSVHKKKNQ